MRGIIYSANIGTDRVQRYDFVEPHFQPESGVHYQLTTGIEASRRESHYRSRQIKILETPKVPASGWVTWLDASMKLLRPIGAKIDEILAKDKPQMVVIKHPWRNCAYAEIDECVRLHKVTEEEGESARRELKRRQHPTDYGLWSLGFIVFNDSLFDLRQDWWMLTQVAMRDQFWLPTLVRQKDIKVVTLDWNIYDNKYFKYKTHGS